jgi:hypothetical protein
MSKVGATRLPQPVAFPGADVHPLCLAVQTGSRSVEALELPVGKSPHLDTLNDWKEHNDLLILSPPAIAPCRCRAPTTLTPPRCALCAPNAPGCCADSRPPTGSKESRGPTLLLLRSPSPFFPIPILCSWAMTPHPPPYETFPPPACAQPLFQTEPLPSLV